MKIKKIQYILFSLFAIINFGYSQIALDSLQLNEISKIIDPRDGTSYEVIRIEDRIWFRDNLKFKTKNSHCPNSKKNRKDCKEGNYYAYTDLKNLCPDGWRVSTLEDWRVYFDYRTELMSVDKDSITKDTLLQKVNKFNEKYFVNSRDTISLFDLRVNYIRVEDHSKKVAMFDPNNPLQLSPLGWIQGRRKHKRGTITFWGMHETSKDPRFHLHIGKSAYVEHTHAHHIDDKRRRRRKFMARCVQDVVR